MSDYTYILELHKPTNDGRRWVKRHYRNSGSGIQQLTWRINDAKTWQTRAAVERWLDRHPGYKVACFVVEVPNVRREDGRAGKGSE